MIFGIDDSLGLHGIKFSERDRRQGFAGSFDQAALDLAACPTGGSNYFARCWFGPAKFPISIKENPRHTRPT
ncbi:MAG TPA: hypothetical protein DCE44_09400 [Verrucomicrobiales bacterium]|nr:hypothetical protein [Verrucomicrobiales bacterium]